MFATLFYGVFSLKTGLLTYVNAGHNNPYKIIKEGTVEEFPMASNVAIGVKENMQFTEGQVQLQAGDSLFLYTDGIPDARNNEGEFFGSKRLRDVLLQASGQPTEKVTDKVVQSVNDFMKGAQQFDDITYLLFKYKA